MNILGAFSVSPSLIFKVPVDMFVLCSCECILGKKTVFFRLLFLEEIRLCGVGTF